MRSGGRKIDIQCRRGRAQLQSCTRAHGLNAPPLGEIQDVHVGNTTELAVHDVHLVFIFIYGSLPTTSTLRPLDTIHVMNEPGLSYFSSTSYIVSTN